MQQKLYHWPMNRRLSLGVAAFVFTGALAASVSVSGQAQAGGQTPPPARSNGWTIPPDAAQETNPAAGSPQAVAEGKTLFEKNCSRCHGQTGRGDGPDGDPDHPQDMDLTQAQRAARNPDGVVFYKAWNGRARPKMPAFKESLSKDDVWKIVTYVQTLRDKQ
jgi:mono/diheme cytochrome c family protein